MARKSYYEKTQEKLEELIKDTEWSASVSQNGDRAETVVEFETASPAGEDFIASLVISGKPTVKEIAGELQDYIDCYDPVAEAMPWVDSEGHGKNGAPDLKELIEDKEYMKGEMNALLYKLTGASRLQPAETEKTAFFDCLAVTQVQVFPFVKPNAKHTVGLASVVLNDQLILRDLRIVDGVNGLFVAYPVVNSKEEDLRTQFFPMTRQLREHIENCVLEKYQYAISQE